MPTKFYSSSMTLVGNAHPTSYLEADVAQLAEQGFCKPQVGGSSPSVSSISEVRAQITELRPFSVICVLSSVFCINWGGSLVANGTRL